MRRRATRVFLSGLRRAVRHSDPHGLGHNRTHKHPGDFSTELGTRIHRGALRQRFVSRDRQSPLKRLLLQICGGCFRCSSSVVLILCHPCRCRRGDEKFCLLFIFQRHFLSTQTARLCHRTMLLLVTRSILVVCNSGRRLWSVLSVVWHVIDCFIGAISRPPSSERKAWEASLTDAHVMARPFLQWYSRPRRF